jgi:hypothetical protein
MKTKRRRKKRIETPSPVRGENKISFREIFICGIFFEVRYMHLNLGMV